MPEQDPRVRHRRRIQIQIRFDGQNGQNGRANLPTRFPTCPLTTSAEGVYFLVDLLRGKTMLKQAAILITAGALLVPSQSLAQNDDGVSVDAAIALAVEDRQPVDAGTSFPADVGTLYAWTAVSGAAGTTVQHVWRHGSHEFTIDVSIGGSPWRVWTQKTIPEEWTGEWTFEVVDADGAVVYTTTFTVGSM